MANSVTTKDGSSQSGHQNVVKVVDTGGDHVQVHRIGGGVDFVRKDNIEHIYAPVETAVPPKK